MKHDNEKYIFSVKLKGRGRTELPYGSIISFASGFGFSCLNESKCRHTAADDASRPALEIQAK